MLRRVALVRTDFTEELSISIIRVTRFSELGTTLAVTSNRRFRRTCRLHLKVERISELGITFFWNIGSKTHGVTFKKTSFLIVTAVKTSDLTILSYFNKTVLHMRRIAPMEQVAWTRCRTIMVWTYKQWAQSLSKQGWSKFWAPSFTHCDVHAS
jgi:hypothetical protein